jgi:ribonuclease HI
MMEVFVDGACEPVNPGGIATYGFVIFRSGERVESGFGTVEKEDTSNNVAEYTAVIQALKRLLERGIRGEQVVFRSDSELLVNQLNGLYAVRAPRVVPLYEEAKALAARLEALGNRLQFFWIPRERNGEADELSKRAYQEYCAAHPEVVQRYAGYLATEKQKQFLRRLGVSFSSWISKREASRLIDERLRK